VGANPPASSDPARRRRVHDVTDPDTEEMLRFRAGEAGAFDRLVARWLRPLAAFFHRLGADAALAEDCASETFWKVYRARETYEPRAKFTTFLFSVARHHWIDVVRHRSIGPPTVSADAGDPASGEPLRERLPSREVAPGAGDGGELEGALVSAIAALPEDHREVFALAQGEALRYQEIAEILGIPVGTVKSRMHAAMRMLRDRLRREGFEP
jgi:RNA polymerase sigma-70 factor (ECF subfamily)